MLDICSTESNIYKTLGHAEFLLQKSGCQEHLNALIQEILFHAISLPSQENSIIGRDTLPTGSLQQSDRSD